MYRLNVVSKKLMYIALGLTAVTLSFYSLSLSSSAYQIIDFVLSIEVALLAISKFINDQLKPVPKKYAWHLVYPVLKNQTQIINKKATRIKRLFLSGLGLFSIGSSIGFLSSQGFLIADLGIALMIISFYLNMHYTPPKTYVWELVFPELAMGEIQDEEANN